MTRKKKLFQKDLAAALRISGSMVSRLKNVGMPVNSVAAAKRWREDNLSPNLTKDVRGWGAETNAACAVHGDPVDHFHHIQNLARGDFEKWATEMQAAMRAIPECRRDEVQLDYELCSRLAAPALARLDAMDLRDGVPDVPFGEAVDSEPDDWFAYQITCGEILVRDPKGKL